MMSARDASIWAARCAGDSEEEIAMRHGIRREKVSQVCTRQRARLQRVMADGCDCRTHIHEPPCPAADPVELRLCAESEESERRSEMAPPNEGGEP